MRQWALATPNARAIMRKSGFRTSVAAQGIPRPILSLEGSRRECFSPFSCYPHDEAQWAIKDGVPYIWGTNFGASAVPPGYPTTFLVPTRNPNNLSGVVDIAGGGATGVCLLLEDGTVLYNGLYRSFAPGVPSPLTELSDVVAIAHHGSEAPRESFYFLKSDGTVSHMGSKGAGMSFSQAPPESWQWRGTDESVIEQMPTAKISNVVEIACQQTGLVFRRGDGTVGLWRWQEEFPEYPSGQPSGVTKIHAANFHPLILTAGGEVWGTGDNTFGQYGNGDLTLSSTPYTDWHKADGTGYTDVAGAGQRVLAARGGTFWSWGGGGSRSGRGVSAAAASTPQDTGVEAVKVFGNYFVQAPMLQQPGGCVMIWGLNDFGWLGRGYRGGEEGTPQILEFSGAYPAWQVV